MSSIPQGPYRTPDRPARIPPEETPLRQNEVFWWTLLWLCQDFNISAETVKKGPAWALWGILMLCDQKRIDEEERERHR